MVFTLWRRPVYKGVYVYRVSCLLVALVDEVRAVPFKSVGRGGGTKAN